MAGSQDTGGLDDVFQRVGNAVHRPAPAPGRQLALGLRRLAQRRLFGRPQEAVQFAVMRGDAREERLRHLDRGQLALPIESVQLGNRQKGDIHRAILFWTPLFNRTRMTTATPASGHVVKDLTPRRISDSLLQSPRRNLRPSLTELPWIALALPTISTPSAHASTSCAASARPPPRARSRARAAACAAARASPPI